MQTGDTVKVLSTGRVGTVEAIRDANRILVKFPTTLRNGQPGNVSIECTTVNLEVLNVTPVTQSA